MNPKLLACTLLVAATSVMQAQTVTYSLPQTVVTVEVDAVQESFFAGLCPVRQEVPGHRGP